MGYKIIQRHNVNSNTRAYLSYNSFTSFFLTNFLINLLVWGIKIALYIGFFPITVYVSVFKRLNSGKSKLIFTLIWLVILAVLFFVVK